MIFGLHWFSIEESAFHEYSLFLKVTLVILTSVTSKAFFSLFTYFKTITRKWGVPDFSKWGVMVWTHKVKRNIFFPSLPAMTPMSPVTTQGQVTPSSSTTLPMTTGGNRGHSLSMPDTGSLRRSSQVKVFTLVQWPSSCNPIRPNFLLTSSLLTR